MLELSCRDCLNAFERRNSRGRVGDVRCRDSEGAGRREGERGRGARNNERLLVRKGLINAGSTFNKNVKQAAKC